MGYDDAKLALLLAAVDPRIGGVLLRGDKGTAKTTLARGLAALLPGAPFVELPLGASEDRVVGAVDVGAALDGTGWRLRPGLLAQADGGVLYVDEVNLLANHLVDVLLDAAATGTGRVERDGLSHAYPARFVLAGSMNPEEGELRPQLLDRFGLVVDVGGQTDTARRAEAVRRRLAFDVDGPGVARDWDTATARLREQLRAAALAQAELPDTVVHAASAVCGELGVETLRADLTLCRAATALARLDGDRVVTEAHLQRVAPLALVHRRRRGPFDPGHVSPDEVRDAFDRMRDRAADTGQRGEAGEPDGSCDDGADPGPQGGDRPDRTADDPGTSDRPSEGRPTGEPAGSGSGSGPGSDSPSAEAPAAGADPGDAEPRRGGPDPAPGADREQERQVALHLDAGRPGAPPLAIPGRARSARHPAPHAGTGAPTGAVIGARRPTDPARPGGIAPAATVLAGVARRAGGETGGAVLSRDDLREPIRQPTTSRTLVVGLDTSASMGADARIRAACAAVLAILLDAYQRRERVALVSIGGEEPRVVLQPTSSVEVARARLRDLSPAGPTPLAAGLVAMADLARRVRADGDDALLVLITDGRATAGGDGRSPFAAALATADHVAAQGLATVLVDAEPASDGLGLAAQLAIRLAARHIRLDALTAEGVEHALRTVT